MERSWVQIPDEPQRAFCSPFPLSKERILWRTADLLVLRWLHVCVFFACSRLSRGVGVRCCVLVVFVLQPQPAISASFVFVCLALFCDTASWLLICMSQVKSPWRGRKQRSETVQARGRMCSSAEMSRHDFSIVS